MPISELLNIAEPLSSKQAGVRNSGSGNERLIRKGILLCKTQGNNNIFGSVINKMTIILLFVHWNYKYS